VAKERDLIEWIRARAPEAGDDCACLDCAPWGTLLVTTDGVIDGVHLDWRRHGPAAFGYKAVARNLSDIAAMAGDPLWAVIAVCLPRGATDEEAKALFLGAERAGCRLVGGDTAVGPVASVVATVLGRARAGGPVLRSGARDGDWIVVSGPLGGSLESGRHFTFTPRVEEARVLRERCDVGAMIDISDGLGIDLHHVLDASGKGCRLEAALVPTNGVPFERALSDGEDYELLATVRPGKLPAGWTRIGTITRGEALLVRADGRTEPLPRAGWEHGT
jgi:thiamine-monophosphate kinase